MPLLFVYGTLRRGGSRNPALARQRFLGPGRTVPGFGLFQVEDYPAMAPQSDERRGVAGEVWEVDAACLERLDRIEGTAEGIFRREPVRLTSPFERHSVEAYHYVRPIRGCPRLGNEWRP